MKIDEDNSKKESNEVKEDKTMNVVDTSDMDQQKTLDIEGGYHPLSLMKGVDVLSACLKDQWIENVEQAVGFLVSSNIEIDGKEQFLVQAKEILGEEVYLKYSTPAKNYPLGCLMAKTEVQVEEQSDKDKSEERGAADES